MNQKYHPAQREQFLKLRAEGMSIQAAAAKVNVSVATAAKWNADSRRAARSSPGPNVTEGSVPAPAPGMGGAKEGSGAGGAEGARRALVDGKEVVVEEVDDQGNAPPPQEESQDPPLDPVEVLIDLAKITTWLQVRFYAARYKVEMTPELESISDWSAADEAKLREYAPGTARLIARWLVDYGAWVAPAFFLFTLAGINGQRIAKVKARGTPPDQKGKPKKPTPSDRKDGKPEEFTDDETMPNGYTPTRAVATDDMSELMRGSFYNRESQEN